MCPNLLFKATDLSCLSPQGRVQQRNSTSHVHTQTYTASLPAAHLFQLEGRREGDWQTVIRLLPDASVCFQVPSNFQGDTRIAQRSHFPHLSHEEIIKNARCQVQIGIFIPDVNIQLPIMPHLYPSEVLSKGLIL